MDNKPEPNNQPKTAEKKTTSGAANQKSAAKTATTPSVAAKKAPAKGLIIGLIVGGVALLGIIILVICCLLMGGEADYEATYNDLKTVETSMETLTSKNCYKVNQDIDDSYTSMEEYQGYIEACVKEFEAVDTAINDFSKSSGVKHNDEIKTAFDNFQSAFKTIYGGKSDIENELSIYAAFHDFYLTIDESGEDTESLKQAVNKAADLFENTKKEELVTFAQGFRERGLAYVEAIEKFQNSSSYSSSLYNDVLNKMNDFVDFIEDEAPETADITKFNADNINNLEDAYYDLESAVRGAYYDSL